ncbi:glycosyltransferase [Burkholderia ubonensis]|uniref:glycosyltransferase n=1 Tax=Burkholderia ubonensis TaxID=101571 RepID=UPI0007561B45|nr:glycosyltransferase [Burkholderia ubonensis]AOI68774.1 glycosyl transferase family 1 [Burkholderia ubonensis]KUZ18028.1 glycosyl transferase family 1 [Burkholderia ubonensis]KUZ22790.1 glycosyl transferase family 1 [Burkholderia ubonensis]KUZ37717.1 glycosyl transferase family 1 [Burkholderia ubonensis]KUZ46600.1 glycosyl transferase family 1 [Burkholderia ubonensis]
MNDLIDVDDATRDTHRAPTPFLVAEPRRTGAAAAPHLRVVLVAEAAGGGVAVHLADLIEGLSAHDGIALHLIVPRGPRFDGSILDAGVLARCESVHMMPIARAIGWRDAISVAHLYRLLRRIRPDIVHSHSSKAGAIARVCRGPWRHVYTPHAVYTLNPSLSTRQRRFYGAIESLLGRRCTNRIIAVSHDEATHLHEDLGIPAHRIKTIVNGVAPPALMARSRARRALGLADDTLVVGFVGRLDHQKGVDRLVRIARGVYRQCGHTVQFVVIGPGDFAAAAGRDANDTTPNLHVVGALERASRYFSALDIFALPSRYEGFPYVCLEAMAAQVPIVASNVAGAAELIQAWRIGLVVPNDDDTTDFTHAIVNLAGDAALRTRMRENCSLAFEHYSAAAMVRRTLDLYRRIAHRGTE